MTPPNRIAAGKARALVDTWLNQKYRKKRHNRENHLPPRMRAAVKSGNNPKGDSLAAFRLWMWDASMLTIKDREDKHGHATYLAYRQQLSEACQQFDRMMEQGSTTAKGRRRGSGFTVGSAKSKPKPKH